MVSAGRSPGSLRERRGKLWEDFDRRVNTGANLWFCAGGVFSFKGKSVLCRDRCIFIEVPK